MDDDLRKLPEFIKLSKKTFQLLVENIVIALSIKLIFFVLTLAGIGTMWMAVFADTGTCLIVVGERVKNASLERLSQLASINFYNYVI